MKRYLVLSLGLMMAYSFQIKAMIEGYIVNKTPYDIFLVLPYSSYSNTTVVSPNSNKRFYNDKSAKLDFPPYVDQSTFAGLPVEVNLESGNYEVSFDENKKTFAIKKASQPLKSAVVKSKK